MPRCTLTDRQRRFAEAWIGEAKRNGTEAARIAGYSGTDAVLASTGSTVLHTPKVAEYIDQLLEGTIRESIAGPVELHEFLTATVRGKRCRAPIITAAGPAMTDDGKLITKAPSATDRIAAARELAKMRGYYAPERQEIAHTGVQVIRIVMPDNGRGPKPE